MQWESIDHIVRETAERSPETAAVLGDGFLIDYASLDDGADYLAEAIESMGVSPLDRVGVYIRSGYEFLVTVLALSRVGAIPALLDVLDDPGSMRRIPTEAGLRFIITHGADAALVEEVFSDDEEPGAVPGAPDFALIAREPAQSTETDEPGIIFFTARDREPVFVSHAAMLENVREIAGGVSLSARDTVAITESMASQESIAVGFSAFLVGGSLSLGRTLRLAEAPQTDMADSSPVDMLASARRRLLGPLDASHLAVPSPPQLRAIVGGNGLLPNGCDHRFGTVRHGTCSHTREMTAEAQLYAVDLTAGRVWVDHHTGAVFDELDEPYPLGLHLRTQHRGGLGSQLT
ncbi:class I adenylate-forming enzyme family protein [Streptomyces sp. TLI_105]|uniref:class I adenylate-forming enzyme family protein n=1 Tax=Streptomyces sp. TLI_105 TaxID=1881019 RepID=UPI000895B9C8|nr:class I adenylate-forming enzyme family protein [Streptomyces sp. TLI_105]SEC31418.1 AMP-binding enzyme [Streptomyces sp. TLI_105]